MQYIIVAIFLQCRMHLKLELIDDEHVDIARQTRSLVLHHNPLVLKLISKLIFNHIRRNLELLGVRIVCKHGISAEGLGILPLHLKVSRIGRTFLSNIAGLTEGEVKLMRTYGVEHN